MNKITVTYIDFSSTPENVLGEEIFKDIKCCIIPEFGPDTHSITISKHFNNCSIHRWKVEAISYSSPTHINIYLSGRLSTQNEEFLRKTYKNNRRVLRNIQLGTLVEVEYGYIPKIHTIQGVEKTAKHYPDLKQKGEMHKRRLAIVISVNKNHIQVVPITSKPQNTDDSIFMLSDESIANLGDYKNNKNGSAVLCSMIQSVSFSRVLPPRAKTGRVTRQMRSTSYPSKIIETDKVKLKNALVCSINQKNLLTAKEQNTKYHYEIIELKNENKELKKNVSNFDSLKKDYDELTRKFQALKELHYELKQQAEPMIDYEKIINSIDSDIDTYIEILNENN